MNADALYDELVAELVPRGAATGSMFGSRSLTYRGKVFATTNHGTFVAKLGAGTPAHRRALELGEPFDPSGKGRPMKDWVLLPASVDDSVMSELVEAAFQRMQDSA